MAWNPWRGTRSRQAKKAGYPVACPYVPETGITKDVSMRSGDFVKESPLYHQIILVLSLLPMMRFVVPPEREKMMGYGTYGAVIDVLEDAVEQGEYLLGDNFSAADVYVGAHVGFGMQFGTIERRSGLEHYWSRVNTRPAAIRAKKIDDDLLPKDTAKT